MKPSSLAQCAGPMGWVRRQQSAHLGRRILPELLASDRLDLGPVEELNEEGVARLTD